MQAVLDKALEQYRRDTFFRDLDESYVQEWESTLMDGLTSE